ncbi:hypothetical protein HPB52_008621 [Rhipicephalus sanguineus]|uniref:RING-type domain-containing protein n=1 Tax=Rhipicephalus sanguineus TaxID=34632 RepID=A0A9D4QE24_RHISA|nr:hypothetical protein HPB52_008621 [Rhipicephalus sanguineus]
MAFWEYTLTGFDDFLEQRRLAFAEPMPASRVCGICGRVPSSTVLLPCGHVSCEQCQQREVFEGMECPFDGNAFDEGQLVRITFQPSDLENRLVFCIVGGRKCPSFAGKLSELRDHMRHCRSIDVTCAKCERPVASEVAVDHYRNCCEEASACLSACKVPLDRAVEEISGVKEGLEIARQWVLGERGGDDDLVNGANGLVEKLVSLDRALSAVQEMAGSVEGRCCSLPSLREKPRASGPFRAASKPGLFITTCKLNNVYTARDSLSRGNKEEKISSELYTLGGYTFKLQCKLLLTEGEDGEEVKVGFVLFLRNGDWDDFLEWPFSKKVALIIAHPTDETKDVRLTSPMEWL